MIGVRAPRQAQEEKVFLLAQQTAELLGVPLEPYHQRAYVTCLDLGAWGAVYTEGWDRQVKLIGDKAKELKGQINSIWIYPPTGDRASALAAADPMIPVA